MTVVIHGMIDPEIMEANVIADDPAMAEYTPAFQTAYGLMRQELNITSYFSTSKRLSL